MNPGAALNVLAGDNAVLHGGVGVFKVLGIGKCDAMSIEQKTDGVFINASLYDAEGSAVVLIRDNKITALNGETYVARQSNDESRLVVRSSRGRELFYLRFLNPTTIQFRGFLGCAGGPVVPIQEGQPIAGVVVSQSCLIASDARPALQVGDR